MPKYVESKLPERLRPADYDEAEHGGLEYIVIGEGDNEVVYQKDVRCTYFLELKLNSSSLTIDEGFIHVPCWTFDDPSIDTGLIHYNPTITCEWDVDQENHGNHHDRYSVIFDRMHSSREKSEWSGEFKHKIPFSMIPCRRITFQGAKGSPPYIHSVDMDKTCLTFDVVLETTQLEKLKALISSGDFRAMSIETSIPLWEKIDSNTKSMSDYSDCVFFSDLSFGSQKAEVRDIKLYKTSTNDDNLNSSSEITEKTSDLTTHLDQIQLMLRRYLLAIIILLIFILVYSV